MHSKIILFFITLVVAGFFYLHHVNPTETTIAFGRGVEYAVPTALLVAAGFAIGVVLMVFNSLFVDAGRAIRDFRAKRERKIREQAERSCEEGTGAFLKGDVKKAVRCFEKALELRPGNRDVIMKLSDAYMEQGEPVRASLTLEKSLERNPDDLEVLFRIAALASRTGEALKAENMFKEALRVDRSNVRALTGLRDMKIRAGSWEEAAGFQKAIVSLRRPEDDAAAARELLASLLYEQAIGISNHGGLDRAGELARQALDASPAFVPALVLLGELSLKAGGAEAAAKRWEKGYDRTGDSVFLMKLEELHIAESNPQAIISTYRRVLERKPGSVEVRLLQARLFLRLEMIDDAIKELEALSDDIHEGGYGEVLLGAAYLRRRQGEKAAILFERALGLERDLSPPFVCSGCGHEAARYLARCPACSAWNMFDMSVAAPAERAVSPREASVQKVIS